MSAQPNNTHTVENPVGRFMVAVGAVIELRDSGKILMTQRSPRLDWKPGEWEIVYGRIDQFEGLELGLRREVKEEVGITDLQLVSILTAWHMYRGTEQTAQNELIGITYRCRTETESITLSDEHSAYKWVTPEEGVTLAKVDGIIRDIRAFIEIVKH